MTTLEKIRAEIEQLENPCSKEHGCIAEVLQIIDKYAEQETDIEYIGEFCHKHGLVLMSKEMADKYAEQETCDDAISRKFIKQKLQEHHDFFVNAYGGFSNLPQTDKARVDEIINCIAEVVNAPSVRPQPKMGHWINKEFRKEEYVLMGKCSVCGRGRVIDGFCSYCGCRMFDPQESEKGGEQW